MLLFYLFFFFFFQAEDGIRDLTVTGVQTCALPIFARPPCGERQGRRGSTCFSTEQCRIVEIAVWPISGNLSRAAARSEERRVGKECRSRWSPDHEKKNRKNKVEMIRIVRCER